MPRSEKKLLFDILNSIANIDVHLDGNRDFSFYLKNITMRRAVERELEIVGEAMNNLLKLNPNVAITDARNVVGQRNRLIHDYDGIDDEAVWTVVMKHLPKLKAEVATLLKD